MRSRIYQDADNSLATRLATLGAALDELKQPQIVGPTNLVTQMIEAPHVSGQAYCATFSQSAVHSFQVTFTADHQAYPLVSLIIRYFTDAACTVEIHPSYAPSTQWPFATTRAVMPTSASSKVMTWNITGAGGISGATGNYYLRVLMLTVDTGTLGVVVTS